jgi:hypothetical protein
MPHFRATVLAVGFLISASNAVHAQQLSAEQRATLERGGHVLVTQQRETSPWPAITVYRLVDATPEEAAAVFMNYDAHHEYIPTLLSSRVSQHIDAATVDVDYVADVPFFRDEHYTVRDHVARDSAGTYLVTWSLLRATTTQASNGYARFSRYPVASAPRSTLIEYHNFAIPGSRLASLGFVRSRILRQSEETVEAMVRRTNAVRTDSTAMARELARLRVAVGMP